MKQYKIETVLIILCAYLAAALPSYSSDEIKEFQLSGPGDIVSSELAEVDPDNENALLINSKGNTKVMLKALPGGDYGEQKLTYSASLKSENLGPSEGARGIAYLELKAHFPDGEELIARGPRVPVSGTTEWRSADTVLYVDKGVSPDTITLDLIVEGTGKVWIEDVRLKSTPLRTDYLFWGHVVVWIVLIIYIYNLIRKQNRLRRELNSLKPGHAVKSV